MNPTVNRRDLLCGGVAGVALAMSQFPLSAFGFAEPEPARSWCRLSIRRRLCPVMLPGIISPTGSRQPRTRSPSATTGQSSLTPNNGNSKSPVLSRKPLALSLADLKARPQKEFTATMECSGNGAGPKFLGAVANTRWTGTPLAPILKEVGVKARGD